MYDRFPLSLRNVEDLLHERGVEISHETVRFWWHRFGPMFASVIRRVTLFISRSRPHAAFGSVCAREPTVVQDVHSRHMITERSKQGRNRVCGFLRGCILSQRHVVRFA